MKVVFWGPTADCQTRRNMDILANTLRLSHGIKIRTFHNYRTICKTRWNNTKNEMIFVDCKNEKDRMVEALFRTADMVIVNFPEKKSVITEYFLVHHEIRGHIFYLMNSSPVDLLDYSKLCQNILRLKEEEIGIMPYSVRFEECYLKNKGFSYQKQAFLGKNHEIDREFWEKTYEIARKLLKMNCLFQ